MDVGLFSPLGVNFLDFQVLVTRHIGRPNMHRRAKFHQNRSNGCGDIAFNVFQNGGRPPSWIVKNLIFCTAYKLWRTNMCHRTTVRQNRPNGFGDIAIFWFLRWPLSAILNFKFFKFLVAHHIGMPNMHRRAKFHQNRSNGCWYIAFNIFQNGGRPPFWI